MECLSFKSGHAMLVVKPIKEDWPIVTVRILVFRLPLKHFITRVLEYKVDICYVFLSDAHMTYW